MKTFEERYTAWIDGQLENGALAAFEQELARRADVGEAITDKADAARLHGLLQDFLQAPALTNPDFFNHQLLARIEAESPRPARSADAGGHARPPLFSWGFARLVGLGAFSLFAAAALYYGLMPPRSDTGSNTVVARHTPSVQGANSPAVENDTPEVAQTGAHPGSSVITLADRSPTPPPIEQAPIEQASDIKTFVPDQPANPTTVTPLHYNKPNVNVLWVNGLEYLPNVPDLDASPSPAPASTPGASP